MTDQPLRRLLVLLCIFAAMPAWTATLDEIAGMIKAGKYADAEAALEPLTAGDKVDEKALRLALELFTVQGRNFSAAAPVDRLLEGPGKADATLLLQGADIARMTGEFAKAEARYKAYVEATDVKDPQHRAALVKLIDTQVLLLNNPAKAYESLGRYLNEYGATPEIASNSIRVMNGVAASGNRDRFYELMATLVTKTPQADKMTYADLYYRLADNSPVEYQTEFFQRVAAFCVETKLYSLDIAEKVVSKLAVEADMNEPAQATREARLDMARKYGSAVMDQYPAARWPEGLPAWVVIAHQKSTNPAVRNQAAATFKKYAALVWATNDPEARLRLVDSMVTAPAPEADPAILADLTTYLTTLGLGASYQKGSATVYATDVLARLHGVRQKLEAKELKDAAAYQKLLETALAEAPSRAVLVMYFEAVPGASPKAALAVAQPNSIASDRLGQYQAALEWANQLEKHAEIPELLQAMVEYTPYGFHNGLGIRTAFSENPNVAAGAKVTALAALFAKYPQSDDLQALINETDRWLKGQKAEAEAKQLDELLAKPGAGDAASPWADYPALEAAAKAKNPADYSKLLDAFIEKHKPARLAFGQELTPATVMADAVTYRLLVAHKWNHDQRIEALMPLAGKIYVGDLLDDLLTKNKNGEAGTVSAEFITNVVLTAKAPYTAAQTRYLAGQVINRCYAAVDRANLWQIANTALAKIATSDRFAADYRVDTILQVQSRLWHRGRRSAEIDAFLTGALAQDDAVFAGSPNGVLRIAEFYRQTIFHQHHPDVNLLNRMGVLVDKSGADKNTWEYYRYSAAANAQSNFRNVWISEYAKMDTAKLPLTQRRHALSRLYSVAFHEGWNGRFEEGKRNYIAVKQWIPAEIEVLQTTFDVNSSLDQAWQAPWKHAWEFYANYGGKTPAAQKEWNPWLADWSTQIAAYLPVLSDTSPQLDLLNQALVNGAADKNVTQVTTLIPVSARSLRERNADADIKRIVGALREAGLEELAASYLMIATKSNTQLASDPRKTAEILLADLSSSMQGLHAINVPRTAPEYDLYLASQHFVMGERDRALELFSPKRALLKDHWSGLNPDFVIYALDWMRRQAMFSELTALLRELRLKSANMPVEMNAGVQLVAADMARSQKNYDLAILSYQAIRQDPQLSKTTAGREATFNLIEVYLEVKNFEAASMLLDRLVEDPDRAVVAQAYLMLARMAYDQEDWDTAMEYVLKVEQADAFADEAGYLKNLIYYQKGLYYIITGSDGIGVAKDREFVTPGKKLRFTITDENLVIAARNQAIDVDVWTSNGDHETVKLFQTEGSTKEFSGDIMPVLGKSQDNNYQLEVLGTNAVTFNISKALREQRNLDFPDKVLLVVSDGLLKASSGEFLTDEERQLREQEMQRMEMRGDVSRREVGRNEKTVRPGNDIYIQVEDADQGRSDDVDTLTVALKTSSGDMIRAFQLTETGPYTGIFQGRVKTGIPLPRASASDSLEGSEPGWMINSTATQIWESAQDNIWPKWLQVDVQQPVPIATMEIEMADDRKVQEVELLASRINLDFNPIASMPDYPRVSGGKPYAGLDITAVQATGATAELGKSPAAIRHALIEGQPLRARLPSNTYFRRESLDSFRGATSDMNLRLFGYFYLPEARQITMRSVIVEGGRSLAWIYIDGQQRTNDRNPGAPFTMQLSAGLHTIEALAYLQGPKVQLRPEYLTETGEWAELPSDWFSADAHTELVDAWKPAATINTVGNKLVVEFNDDTRYRQLRVIFKNALGDSIKVKKITIMGRDGKQIVPQSSDFSSATQNDVLEIAAGDDIQVTYVDELRLNKDERNRHLTETLSASFYNARITMDVEKMDETLHRDARFFPAKRVKVGDNLMIRVEDWDMDATDKQDVVDVVVEATNQQPVKLKAKESEAHSGVFLATLKFRDTAGDANTIVIAPGSQVTAKYFDEQNTDPGVGVDRSYQIFEAGQQAPKVTVLQTETKMVNVLDENNKKKAADGGARKILAKQVIATWPGPTAGTRTSVDAPLLFLVQSPSDALNELSTLSATVTSKSMQDAGEQPYAFKMRLVSLPDLASQKGYGKILFMNVPLEDRLTRGLFAGIVRLQLGKPGDLVDDKVMSMEAAFGTDSRIADKDELASIPATIVQGNDQIILNIQSNGGEQTQVVDLYCDGQLHFMDRTFEEEREGFYLGETLNLQVTDFDLDISAENDVVNVTLEASGGDKVTLQLSETLQHSGVFSGTITPVYRRDLPAAGVAEPAVNTEDNDLLIGFGETLTASFTDTNHREGTEPQVRNKEMTVFLGSDGLVNTFSLQFKDEDIAVKTAFTVAEAYFELAKEHRKLEKPELAEEEISTGKRLLTEALTAYPNTKYAAQAEYLLANLAQELAEDTGKFEEAIGGYTTILQRYPTSDYAPKAQYKLALCYEKLERWDQAVEEYVKITYKYPNDPLVASVIIRLGQYFWRTENYIVAGDVFKSFQKRFPDHALASKAMLLSGQSYIKSKDYAKAIEILQELVDTYVDDRDVRAEAMYWLGDSQRNSKNLTEAYKTLKKLTWDYPETKWAKMARALLLGEEFSRIADQLERG